MLHFRTGLLASLLISSTVFADAHSAVDAHTAAPAGPTAEPAGRPSADQAYRQLLDGQSRFATDTRVLPHQGELRRCETTTGGQHPIAAILTCADSRVPPEMLFDQGIGDLFVVRVAGNVAAADELGTLEYGVDHLQIPLIVVLGHSRCGAVTAVVNGAHAEGNLAQLLKPIGPAADRARHDHADLSGPALVATAIQENVRQAMHDLTANSPAIAAAVEAGRVKIVGGVYDIHAGRIDWLSDTRVAAILHTKEEPAPAPQPRSTHDDHATPAAAHASDSHAKPHDAPDTHAAGRATSHAAPPAASEAVHEATAGKITPTASPTAKASIVPTAIAEHAYLIAGMMGASTLIGAGITRLAPRGKA